MILKRVGKPFKPKQKDVMSKEDIDKWLKRNPPTTSNRGKKNSLGDKKNKRRH